MCGIVGFTGRENATPIILDGLKRLEYRGYDSAGVVVYSDDGLKVIKTKGEVDELYKATEDGNALRGNIGLGHTRWATHGEPSDVNAHPHLSYDGKIAVVHNGIIENYQSLRKMLESNGFVFKSQTDTEVAVNLIQYFYKGDILNAIAEATRRMEGSYALGVVCEDNPDKLFAVRMESPLIVGKGEGCNIFASDVTAIIKHTRDVYYLDDGDIIEMDADGIKFYDSELQPLEKTISKVEWDISAAEKGGYEHFMFKEIMEQPDCVRKTIHPRMRDGRVVLNEISLSDEYLKSINRIFIVSCGSAYHVGIAAKYNIEKLTRIPVEVALASEFRYSSPILDEKSLVICISQSGTTADTLAALREAKRLGAKVLSIVNVVGSYIAQESDDVLYTHAGPEIAVATTKGYTTQLVVTYLFALYLADIRGTIEKSEYTRLVKELERLPDLMQQIVDDQEHIKYLASLYFNNDDIFFIGRNLDYAITMEASLKLKEISYIHSEAYAAGELKHGTIALVEKGDDHHKPTLVIASCTYEALIDKITSNVEEVRSRGAEILSITTGKNEHRVSQVSDNMIVLPDMAVEFVPSLAVVAFQIFSYYMALLRGCNIDKPRNLAKSVTVE